MTTLGNAVHGMCVKKGVEVNLDRVEEILAAAGVATSATTGIPVRLRVRRVSVSGTKVLPDSSDNESREASDGVEGVETVVPFEFDWSPQEGVNGVGSDRNLRGKSSVLHFVTWALTGRCPLQADVLSWVERVRVVFSLDEVVLVVAFDVQAGTPSGSVVQQGGDVGPSASLGVFANEAEFESLMGRLMLERLRLEPIAMWVADRETSHAWPAYASALAVDADRLDTVVGNESILGTRMLQMFVGTPWAPARAQTATAVKSVKHRRETTRAKATAAVQAVKSAVDAAMQRVAQAQGVVDSFDPAAADVAEVLSVAARASDSAAIARDVAQRLQAARSAAAEVHQQLRAERARRNTAAEDALARRFFNAMTPTVCPRCSAAVSDQRREAEGHDHTCSLCASDLDLNAFAGDVVIASDLAEDVRRELVTATTVVAAEHEDAADTGDGEAAAVDPLIALQLAADDADATVAALEDDFGAAEQAREAAAATAQQARDSIARAHDKHRAELELARAQGALDSLRATSVSSGPEPVDETELAVLEAADAITAAWLKESQDPLLTDVSDRITKLARSFGADNITRVSLKGNANMEVHKGGAKCGYSALRNGEKLRIKLATAIALIAHGHEAGVGRHPGLLLIDSPAAEEIPADDLKVMLQAMIDAANAASMQIIVATTHGPLLTSLLPQDRVLVAAGDAFVW